MSAPLSMPADEFALVKQVAAAMGLDPAAPLTVEQHDALPGTMAPGLSPVTITMTDEQAAEFAERFAAAREEQKGRPQMRVLHRELLSPEEIRSLLRECVTVVKPGEVLVIRVSENMTPRQCSEYQQAVDGWIAHGDLGIKVMVLPGEGLGITESVPERDHAAWLRDVRYFMNGIPGAVKSVTATHRPTGLQVTAPTQEQALTDLAALLQGKGKITINDARAAIGLPAWDPEAAS